MITAWWGRLTLHHRLSLLVTAAVAAAVVTLAAGAWLTVAEIQDHQLRSQLVTDAETIAADPGSWHGGGPTVLADPDGDPHHGHSRLLEPRWQVLNAEGAVVNHTGTTLPVTAAAKRIAASGSRPVVQDAGDNYRMITVAASGGGAVQVAADTGQDDHVLTIFGLLLLAGCIVGIGGAALLGRVVARAGLRPVQKLTDSVEDVAVTMDLDKPIPVDGVDEIARLGGSVNTMLAAIGAARRAQRSLVEDASHELRTPLTSIRTNIELLLTVERRPDLAHRLPPEDRRKLLEDLDAQIGELATLTTELVELSREETAREDPEPLDLADVAEAAAARIRLRKPLLTYDVSVRPTPVEGRPGELERMIVNVLDNAAKFSPPGGVISLALDHDAAWCALRVTDAGPGIDEAHRPHVFDRFYRAPAARSLPGSGLGLAIVAQTAAHHGGTVTVTPNEPSGTVVTIRLPVTTTEPR